MLRSLSATMGFGGIASLVSSSCSRTLPLTPPIHEDGAVQLEVGSDAAWTCVDSVLLDVFTGDAAEHLSRIESAVADSTHPADRALYGVAATIAAVIACEFDRAAEFAARAALEGEGCAPAVRSLALAAATMARAMAGQASPIEAPLDANADANATADTNADPDPAPEGEPRSLLLRYFLAEAALSSGSFEQADALIAAAGLAPGQVSLNELAAPTDQSHATDQTHTTNQTHPADQTHTTNQASATDQTHSANETHTADQTHTTNQTHPTPTPEQLPTPDGAAVALQLLAARSAAFHGRRDEVIAIARGLQQRVSVVPPRALTVLMAIGCYGAAVTGDRDRSATLAETVLTRTRGDVNYLSVGACLYVAWDFRNVGQLQRAAALLVSAAGPNLDRCKVWDRAFAAEVLIEAALARGDRYRAGALLRSTGALARYAVAAASVSRARGVVALSGVAIGRLRRRRATLTPAA